MNAEPQRPEWAAAGRFNTTHWTVVLAAGGPDPALQAAALEELCRSYWYPLYAYIRRRGKGPDDAQDLTQEFFSRLLEKQWLEGVEKNGSRFRSFLLSALNAFLANHHDHTHAAKRGGGRPPIPLDGELAENRYALELLTNETPERIYDRRWALTVLDRALARLRGETAAAGKARHFELLNPFLSREPEAGEYATVAGELGVSQGALGVSVHRLRQRYRECVRAEIADTVADPVQVEAEMQELFACLRS